jgi:hypothetical protein
MVKLYGSPPRLRRLRNCSACTVLLARGHHFDTQTWDVSEVRVVIAGADFDPSSLV